MSIKNTLDEVEKLYTNNLEQHGISSKSVGWKDKESQVLRFEKLSKVIKDEESPFSVNDLGCGYGAMFEYLESTYGSTLGCYNGYDISQPMLNKGKELFHSPKIKWNLDSKLQTTADYSFASGIFNVKFTSDDNQWEKYIFEVLHNMNEFSRKGFAFNLLSTYVDFHAQDLYYGDPCQYFDYCKKHFSKRVTLLHDYPLWEWTLVVIKDV